MSDRPSRHGTNDRRILGADKNGIRINESNFRKLGDQPSVPERCSACNALLHGSGFDSPIGWLCGIDCPVVAVFPAPSSPKRTAEHDGCVPFRETNLERPS